MARIFNTYGPRMATGDGRVVSNFIVQALRGEALTVFGEGTQTRSFCFVDDLLTGIERLVEHESVQVPVNLGNTEEFTMMELAQQVRKLTGLEAPLVHKPLPADDPRQRRPDLSRARELLGYEPKIDLHEGLTRTVAFFRERLARPAPMPV
jgi:nucleoside-diphosphate-sugar epimerase